VELDGGFECDCSDGYEIGDDGTTCEGTMYIANVLIIIPTY